MSSAHRPALGRSAPRTAPAAAVAPLLTFTAVYLLCTYLARVEIWKEFFKWKEERRNPKAS